MAGWLPDPNEKKYPKTSHVGFGLVLGADGKRFRTRSTEVVRLVDLLDEAKSRTKSELVLRLGKKGKRCKYGNSFASYNKLFRLNMNLGFVQVNLVTGLMRN